jgi:hypothetical protein
MNDIDTTGWYRVQIRSTSFSSKQYGDWREVARCERSEDAEHLAMLHTERSTDFIRIQSRVMAPRLIELGALRRPG